MIWPTKYGTWAVSLTGHDCPEFRDFADADRWEMMIRKLDDLMNISISREEFSRWVARDQALRARHQKVEVIEYDSRRSS